MVSKAVEQAVEPLIREIGALKAENYQWRQYARSMTTTVMLARQSGQSTAATLSELLEQMEAHHMTLNQGLIAFVRDDEMVGGTETRRHRFIAAPVPVGEAVTLAASSEELIDEFEAAQADRGSMFAEGDDIIENAMSRHEAAESRRRRR